MAAATRPRLGELLLAKGVCAREQLAAAWEQKVLYGDRLGTNLLAAGVVDEERLARALGQQHGVHSGHGGVIKVEAEAVALVSRALAEKRFVVPHHIADRQLFLLMRDPLDAVAIDEVRFATGMKVIPVVACEARMWQLLETHYGARPTLRPVPLGGAPRKPEPLEDATGSILLGPELVSEEEFERLYAGLHRLDDRSPLWSLPSLEGSAEAEAPPPIGAEEEATEPFGQTTPGRPSALRAQRQPGEGEGADGFLMPPRTNPEMHEWRESIEHTNPMLAMPRVIGRPLTEEDEPLVDLVEVDVFAELPPPLVRQATLDFHVTVAAPTDEPLEDRPLSFAEASRALATAEDRNAIARIVLRAARTRFERACLLTVFPDRLVGWLGLGEGMETERLRGVVLDRRERSVFGVVADSRAHYLGPLPRWSAHGGWVKATGRKIPRSLAVFPLLVKGRPVSLLVVDNGHDRHADSDVGEVLILAQQIAKAWEGLLARR
jgi:hypothetical protein